MKGHIKKLTADRLSVALDVLNDLVKAINSLPLTREKEKVKKRMMIAAFQVQLASNYLQEAVTNLKNSKDMAGALLAAAKSETDLNQFCHPESPISAKIEHVSAALIALLAAAHFDPSGDHTSITADLDQAVSMLRIESNKARKDLSPKPE